MRMRAFITNLVLFHLQLTTLFLVSSAQQLPLIIVGGSMNVLNCKFYTPSDADAFYISRDDVSLNVVDTQLHVSDPTLPSIYTGYFAKAQPGRSGIKLLVDNRRHPSPRYMLHAGDRTTDTEARFISKPSSELHESCPEHPLAPANVIGDDAKQIILSCRENDLRSDCGQTFIKIGDNYEGINVELTRTSD